MIKKFAIYLTLSCALALSAGCVSHLAQKAGELAGAQIATPIAQALPTPHAELKTTVVGGDWCAVMEAKGWPKHPKQSVIDHMTSDELATFVSISGHGEKFCGWKP